MESTNNNQLTKESLQSLFDLKTVVIGFVNSLEALKQAIKAEHTSLKEVQALIIEAYTKLGYEGKKRVNEIDVNKTLEFIEDAFLHLADIPKVREMVTAYEVGLPYTLEGYFGKIKEFTSDWSHERLLQLTFEAVHDTKDARAQEAYLLKQARKDRIKAIKTQKAVQKRREKRKQQRKSPKVNR